MKVTNQNQFKQLVFLMEQNPHLARAFNKNLSRMDIMREWDGFAEVLNSLGPPTRDGLSWQKVWTDYKFNVKKKLFRNKNAFGRRYKQLSELEESVANFINLDKTRHLEEAALHADLSMSIHMSDTEDTAKKASSSTYSFSPPNSPKYDETVNVAVPHHASYPLLSRPKKTLNKHDLLKEQITMQENLYIKVKESLKKIEHHLSVSETYEKRRFELDKERLKLYKRKLDKAEEQRIEENKMRMAELDVKKRKLALEELKMKMLFENLNDYA